MATVAKVHSEVLVDGTLYSTLQLKLFKLEFTSALTEDTQAGGAGTAITEGTFRKVMEEIGTTAMLFELHDDNKQSLIVVGDGHALDVDTLATRVGRIIDATGGPDGTGVWSATGGAGATVLTVTEPGTTRGL